jgi:hypothetical protein
LPGSTTGIVGIKSKTLYANGCRYDELSTRFAPARACALWLHLGKMRDCIVAPPGSQTSIFRTYSINMEICHVFSYRCHVSSFQM